MLVEEDIAQPILLGDEKIIVAKAKDLFVSLAKIEVVNPQTCPKREMYVKTLYELRQRHGERTHSRNCGEGRTCWCFRT